MPSIRACGNSPVAPPATPPLNVAPRDAGRHEPLLSVRGLSTSFDTHDGVIEAIQAIDLDVMRNECLGVVGESGSGKSVTFASVMGLIKPPGRVTRGSVRFDGVELRQLSAPALRRVRGRQIAMTMQDALSALNPVMTIGAQLCEGIRTHADDVARLSWLKRGRAARNRAVEMMERVGIPTPRQRLGEYPHQFSGGMRQRIMMAIALACGPRLLIADEPTSALDVTVQAQVLELIADFRERSGMSVVLITHDLAVVAEHCDRVVVMYAGQVVESGATADVIGNPRHPYTRGLLASMPDPDDPWAPIRPIQGTVPSLVGLARECRFYSRCAERQPECLADIPVRSFGDGRTARCLFAVP